MISLAFFFSKVPVLLTLECFKITYYQTQRYKASSIHNRSFSYFITSFRIKQRLKSLRAQCSISNFSSQYRRSAKLAGGENKEKDHQNNPQTRKQFPKHCCGKSPFVQISVICVHGAMNIVEANFVPLNRVKMILRFFQKYHLASPVS